MKYSRVQQIICIQEQTAAAFQERVNEALMTVASPRIEMDRNVPFTCYIFYTEEKKEAETIADEYELAGCGHTCEECPHLERTGDKRRKKFRCKYAEHGLSCLSMPACDKYYEEMERRRNAEIQEGRYRPNKSKRPAWKRSKTAVAV